MIDVKDTKASLDNYSLVSNKLARWSGRDINELDSEYNYSSDLIKVYKALDELERLQEKETPVTPIDTRRRDDWYGKVYKCTSCGKEEMMSKSWQHCPHCGVKLDWSHEK